MNELSKIIAAIENGIANIEHPLVAEISAWIAKLKGHPAVVAAVAAPEAPAEAPKAPTSSSTAPAAPKTIPLGPAGADGKPTVVFTGTPSAEAISAFVSEVHAQTGDYNFTVVNAKGEPLDNAGNVIAPSGTVDNTPAWSSFDGHPSITEFKAGVPVFFSVTGAPAAQGFNFGWYEATFPCEMTVVATRNGQEIARADPGSGHGNGNGGMLAVPGGDGDVSIAVTAPIDTQRAVAIKP